MLYILREQLFQNANACLSRAGDKNTTLFADAVRGHITSGVIITQRPAMRINSPANHDPLDQVAYQTASRLATLLGLKLLCYSSIDRAVDHNPDLLQPRSKKNTLIVWRHDHISQLVQTILNRTPGISFDQPPTFRNDDYTSVIFVDLSAKSSKDSKASSNRCILHPDAIYGSHDNNENKNESDDDDDALSDENEDDDDEDDDEDDVLSEDDDVLSEDDYENDDNQPKATEDNALSDEDNALSDEDNALSDEDDEDDDSLSEDDDDDDDEDELSEEEENNSKATSTKHTSSREESPPPPMNRKVRTTKQQSPPVEKKQPPVEKKPQQQPMAKKQPPVERKQQQKPKKGGEVQVQSREEVEKRDRRRTPRSERPALINSRDSPSQENSEQAAGGCSLM